MATAANGELLALSGPRNPYPGKLGVVEEGALADLLVVNGDPIADLALLARPETSLAMIMKGGQIYKDTLRGQSRDGAFGSRTLIAPAFVCLLSHAMEAALLSARRDKNFAVVVWVKKTEAFNALRAELVAIADNEPEESTEYEGMVDFHWRFDSHAEAKRLANSLREIARAPEIMVLRVSNYDNVEGSVTFKDTRRARH
jgi:hypothetical protein